MARYHRFIKHFGGIESLYPENVPRVGPFIASIWHRHASDPVAVGTAALLCLPGNSRELNSLGKIDIWQNKRYKRIAGYATAIGSYPVDRDSGLNSDVAAFVRNVVRSGGAIGIFGSGITIPYDRITPTIIDEQVVKKGVAYFAKKNKIPILPVGVAGTEFRDLGHVRIGFGPLIEPDFRNETIDSIHSMVVAGMQSIQLATDDARELAREKSFRTYGTSIYEQPEHKVIDMLENKFHI